MLLYLYLEYKANIWLWVVGIIMPIVHGTLYFKSGLYADCSMQVYYILAGLYGLVAWSRKPSTKTQDAFNCYTKRFGSEDASNVDIFEINKKDIPKQ